MLIVEQERISEAPTRDGIDIFHHAAGAVDDSEIITKQFLTPSTEEHIRTIIIEQRFKRDAISDPAEVTTPENRRLQPMP